MYYLRRLGFALYPVVVLAAPLPGRGALPSVPAALPPLVSLTSERRQRKKHKQKETNQAQNHVIGEHLRRVCVTDLPFRRGRSGFPPRAPGPVLTLPPVAPDDT